MSEAKAPHAGAGVRRNRWALFLAAWTLFVLAILGLWLWIGMDGTDGRVLVLRDETAPRESLWVSARRNLLLAHFSFSRAYPWVLLAPYVFWVALRFHLERQHLRRHLLVQGLGAAAFVAASQLFLHEIRSVRPLRLIVAVTETSAPTPDGTGAEMIRHIRQELRLSPSGTDATSITVDAEDIRASELPSDASPPVAAHRSLGFQANDGAPLDLDLPDGPDIPLPMAFVWRTWLSSAAVDLFVFASLCGLGQAIHFRRRFQERERQASALESSLALARLHTLQAQLQPHFLFNTLNSIASLVRQNPSGAEDMLTSLSDLLRLSLSRASHPWSSVREELRFTQLYLDIQHTRFGDRLNFVSQIEPATLDCTMPALLLQPLIENAIRHGLEPTGAPGWVRVEARIDRETLELCVEDNGTGCQALLQGSATFGVGLTNVRERLLAAFQDRASLAFEPGDRGGLRVRIRMPRSISPEGRTSP